MFTSYTHTFKKKKKKRKKLVKFLCFFLSVRLFVRTHTHITLWVVLIWFFFHLSAKREKKKQKTTHNKVNKFLFTLTFQRSICEHSLMAHLYFPLWFMRYSVSLFLSHSFLFLKSNNDFRPIFWRYLCVLFKNIDAFQTINRIRFGFNENSQNKIKQHNMNEWNRERKKQCKQFIFHFNLRRCTYLSIVTGRDIPKTSWSFWLSWKLNGSEVDRYYLDVCVCIHMAVRKSFPYGCKAFFTFCSQKIAHRHSFERRHRHNAWFQ